MKRVSTLLLSSLLAFILIFAVGCDTVGSSDSTSQETGTLELRMDGATTSSTTNALTAKTGAAEVEKALVTITKVSIVPSDSTSEGDSTEVGVRGLTDKDFEVDLKRLQSGLDTLMTEINIPEGTYGQLRLIVDGEVDVTFADGTQRSVMIASGEQTGLKPNFAPFTIDSSDDGVRVTVNWNVEKSLQGNPRGNLVITPVINDVTVEVIAGEGNGGSAG